MVHTTFKRLPIDTIFFRNGVKHRKVTGTRAIRFNAEGRGEVNNKLRFSRSCAVELIPAQ